MASTRRGFIEAAAANAAALAIFPASALASAERADRGSFSSEEWNVAWADKLKGKHKALFDMTEVESGYGVWRAAAWAGQYMDVMKVAPADLSSVLILRHNAIVLAMQQSFWDKYNIGELKKVTHPLTAEPTKKNPVLLDERDGIPAPFNNAALHKQIARGATALACNLALQDCVNLIASTDKVGPDVAYKQAVGYLVPGVILQPSGVFAAVRAQEAGAAYVKAS
jgi:hypothetical protein